ncbi:S8 family serine peptidase [Myxococcota bacterium]|nr:S8 family serine peptidase [Myxococcota bacterium]
MQLIRRASLVFASLAFAACSGATGSDLSETTSKASSTTRYILVFKDLAEGRASLSRANAKVALELAERRMVAAHLPEEAVKGLQNNPNVELIEEDVERYPTAQVVPYGISMVQATDPAFAVSSARNRKVCIIDSGLYTGHEDLSGIPVTGQSGTAWNEDGCGHGTHVAGTIAALDNTAGVIGVAPSQVSLHIVRVFGNDCAWAYASTLVAAVDECRRAGANVINMSLGGSRSSRTEETAFNQAWNAGVLSIAAAGNDGNTRMSYPASYSTVVSVAAIDSNKQIASFSQQNSAVDVSAPGVGVLSTVPFTSRNDVTVNGTTYSGTQIEFAAYGTATGALVDGGLCDSVGSWAGRVVLCQRGVIGFVDKVNNAQSGGAVAVIIYNNVSGGFSGTLGAGNTSNVPAIGISMEDGQALVANNLGQSATVVSTAPAVGSGYEAWDGTSMATPHVVGVAALVWSQNTAWTNAQIRQALEATAEDLGAAGRDNAYGVGLVRAKAALDYLNAPQCPATETNCTDGLDNDCDGRIDSADSDCGSACFATNARCTSNSQCCSGVCRSNGRCR